VTHDLPVTHSDDNGPKRRWRSLDLAGKAGVVSAWLAALSAVIAVLAWVLPRTNSDASDKADASQGQSAPTVGDPVQHGSATTAPTAPTAAGQSPAATVTYLDGIVPKAAGGNIVPLPRNLRDRAGFASHPLVIHCPTNETGDETSNVTFTLNGRYVRVDATVWPYYPDDADQQSVTHVLADVGIREIDAEMTTQQAGVQQRATPGSPAPLTAVVERAQELTLKVACDDPRGLVVLTDARLTAAD
jgi:hypothetical protein